MRLNCYIHGAFVLTDDDRSNNLCFEWISCKLMSHCPHCRYANKWSIYGIYNSADSMTQDLEIVSHLLFFEKQGVHLANRVPI